MIYYANPYAQFKSLQKPIVSSINRVIKSKNYILGQEVLSLEKEFSRFINVNYSVGVANGTDAIELSLRCLGIGENDEVISVSHTATASISAICATNAKAVLVDVEPEFYNINVDEVQKAINSKTKAILAVHLYGHPAKINELKLLCKKNNLFLIEDCSQAHGSMVGNKKVGSIGDIACFSCYPTKNLGGIGDAGIITTNKKTFYDKLIKLRQYGWNKKGESLFLGRNSRLDEIQAAILRVKLKSLEESNLKRRKVAKYYFKELKNLPIQLPKEDTSNFHVYHLFVIKLEDEKLRNNIINYFKQNDIILGIHYPVPVHKQKGFQKIIKIKSSMKVSEGLSKRIISLPIYPEIKRVEVYKVINLFKKFFYEGNK